MRLDSFSKKIKLIFTKYYIIVLVIVVLVIFAVGYFILISGTVNKIQTIGLVEIKNKQLELASKKATLTRLQQLQKSYNTVTSEEIKQLNAFLPLKSDIPYLVIELKKFVESNGLILGSIDVGPLTTTEAPATGAPAAANTVTKLTINLLVSKLDSYSALKEFLDKLSRNQPLLELTSISYVPGNDSYSLNLTTYYQ
jgi:Tfp pilus assembly protein PilO